ncbi:MAG: RibD family protein [Meiothermus sp.]|nr:RibD family protein [Meiothermus sp.]
MLQPFEVLLEDPDSASGPLPPSLAQVYGGGLRLAERRGRPLVFSNFVLSRDGRTSFNLPGQAGGGEVSAFNPHDQWLMGLLRARADAVMVGDGTLRLEPEHLWTSNYICPTHAEPFSAWRLELGLPGPPLQVIVSLEGDFPPEAAVFGAGLEVLIATTPRGLARAEERAGGRATVLVVGEESGVDLRRLGQLLYADFGIRALLCEGGPRLIGSVIRQGQLDEEFLCLSPVVIGQNSAEGLRPGLIEGVGFTPELAPRSRPVSLRRAGDYLFLRSRYEYRGA